MTTKRFLYTGPISDDLRPGTEYDLDDEAPRTACLLASRLITPVAPPPSAAPDAPQDELAAAGAADAAVVEEPKAPASTAKKARAPKDEIPKTERAPKSPRPAPKSKRS